MVRLLISAGARLEQRNHDNQTPLDLALAWHSEQLERTTSGDGATLTIEGIRSIYTSANVTASGNTIN